MSRHSIRIAGTGTQTVRDGCGQLWAVKTRHQSDFKREHEYKSGQVGVFLRFGAEVGGA